MADQAEDYYFHLVKCTCGNEWYIISEKERHVVKCHKCDLLHDVWLEQFLMMGTMEEIVGYLEPKE